MAQKFANAARGVLASAIAPGTTTIEITEGGDLFPAISGDDWFKAVLQDADGIEIVRVNAHTSASNSFTVVRGQEGTTARSFAVGSVFGQRVTAGDMEAATAEVVIPAETDPVFSASTAAGITGTQVTNWDTAYGWGNHSSAGYLTSAAIGTTVQGYNANTVIDASYVHTDNNYTTTEKNKLAGIAAGAEVNVNADWNAISGDAQILNKPTLGTAAAANTTDFATAAQGAKADTALQPAAIGVSVQAYDADLTSIAGLTGTSGLLKKTAANTWSLDTNVYLTSYTETDPVFSASAAAGITTTNIGNWNTAYGWGNHATAGYLTSAAIGTTVQGYNANTVIDAAYVHTDNNYTTAEKTKLSGIAAGAEVNVNADWNAVSGDAQILNKPTLGTAAAANTTDFATAAQGAKADTALQPAAIGTTVQAYDADLTSWAAIAPSAKQDRLVSGTNIKTVGGVSLLGSGDVPVSAFPSGTVMIFAQTAAPTGWTKSTTHNDKALRVVSGTASSGGTAAFSSVFASRTPTGSVSTTVNNTTATGSVSTTVNNTTATGSVSTTVNNTTATGSISTTVNSTTATGTVGATTLSTAQIPSHTHVVNAGTNAGASGTAVNVNSGTTNSQATGGGGSHDHSFSGTSHSHTASSTFTGTAHNHTASSTFTGTAHNHTASSTFTGTAHNHTASSSFTGGAMDFAVRYVDVILASKD